RVYCPNGTAGGGDDGDFVGIVLVLFPWKGAAIPYGGANTRMETAAGVELSGAVYRLFDGAGVKTRAVGTGDCGGGLCAAGTSRGAQCGLDAAAGVHGDVYRRPFTNPTASFAGRLE